MFSGETTVEPSARCGGPEERVSDKCSDSWLMADVIVPNGIDARLLSFHPPSPGRPDWLLAQGWSYPDTAARLFPNLTGFHVIETPRQTRHRAAGSYVKEQNCYGDERRPFPIARQAASFDPRVMEGRRLDPSRLRPRTAPGPRPIAPLDGPAIRAASGAGREWRECRSGCRGRRPHRRRAASC